jgi:fucose permease
MAHPTATETTPLITPETHIIESQNRSSRIEPDATDRIRRERSLDSPALKTAATMFSFFILGLFIASTGVMLPHLMSHYSISDLEVSTLFLVMPAGYILAASSNSFLHSRFGQRGVAVLGPLLHIISAVAVAFKPRSFAAIVAGWGIMALGTGLLDASWCAHAASQPNANKISGFLHGSFSAGAAVGPFVVGSLMAKGVQWSTWYWVLVSFF